VEWDIKACYTYTYMRDLTDWTAPVMPYSVGVVNAQPPPCRSSRSGDSKCRGSHWTGKSGKIREFCSWSGKIACMRLCNCCCNIWTGF